MPIKLSNSLYQISIGTMVVLLGCAHADRSYAAIEPLLLYENIKIKAIDFQNMSDIADDNPETARVNCSGSLSTHIIWVTGIGAAYCARCSCETEEQCRAKCQKCQN